METVGIFYGSTSGSTKSVAEKIKKAFGKNADLHDIKEATPEMIAKYTNLVFGTSAWGIGDMQDDWEDFIDSLSEVDFTEKKVALFGLGDQAEYPESFVDGLGTMYCRLPDKSVVTGFWPTKGYKYYFSLAERDDKFVGLAIDDHQQPELTDDRVKTWVEQVKKEFI
ncbi:MAG: flavodoxin [Bacteroidales bacterium]|nr:flavodoxin [Bacteroidales bacterium]MDP2236772.1 flavodoxin [Bacteroidales bacterium]